MREFKAKCLFQSDFDSGEMTVAHTFVLCTNLFFFFSRNTW
jgi:hypothetical protein